MSMCLFYSTQIRCASTIAVPLLIEALAKLGHTSAPGHPLSLAGFGIMFVCSNSRQSLLRPGATFTSGNLQNLPVLQVARLTIFGVVFVCAFRSPPMEWGQRHLTPFCAIPCGSGYIAAIPAGWSTGSAGPEAPRPWGRCSGAFVGWMCRYFFSDHWESCAELIPAGMLVQGKARAHAIVRSNFRQRHRCDRFRWKTCIVSRCPLMVGPTVFF